MNMFTKEEMENIVNQAKEQATKNLEKQILEGIDYGVKMGVCESVKKQVSETVEAEIKSIAETEWSKAVPQVRDIISQSFIVIAEALARAMTEQAIKSLDGYNRKDIIKKLFDIF